MGIPLLPPSKTPKVTVVGGGLGDPELLTIKGMKTLQHADVVLYDALVHPDLLGHVPPHAVRVYVGKRRQCKAFTQNEINALVVKYAQQYGHVVRLKGGDPYVFGRGMEELQAAQAAGIETAYVPGISSAIGAAGVAGISVTLRGTSRSFWVMTATTETGELNPELAEAVQTQATVVVLMGLAKLDEITALYMTAGRGNIPIAVIENASLPEQRSWVGTLQTIGSEVAANQPLGPTVLVIGEVVKHRILPLFCKQVPAVNTSSYTQYPG